MHHPEPLGDPTPNPDSIGVDVLIVGAGPTGLLLAGDLAARGVPCTVAERRAAAGDLTRAFIVHARTLEHLDARGLADDLIRTGALLDTFALFGIAEVSLASLPGRFPNLLVTPQYQVENVLRARAEKAGAQILRGLEVTGLEQDEDGVTVRASWVEPGKDAEPGPGPGPGDEPGVVVRARYVVGTDGVESTVRSLIGVPFPGRTVLRSMMLADVKLTDPPADVLAVNAGPGGFAFVGRPTSRSRWTWTRCAGCC